MLTKYVSGSKTVDIQYDGRGMRVAKTRKIASNTTNSTYIYDSQGKLRTEIEDNTTRNYIYGQDGVVGYEENDVHFMYRKNFFGDIVAIYQGATKIVEYSYDAWGNCTITYDPDGYGASNPIRYRGYYWDSDIKMYYLMTRYYDPKIGRFINADSFEYLDPKSINGLNLYAYCRNNPIMHIDPMGTQFCQTSFDGEYDLDDDMYNSGGGGGGGAYYGYGSAYYTYTVRTNTATYDAQLGGYHSSGTTSAMTNPSYFIVPGAVTVTDGMVTEYFCDYSGHSLPNSASPYSTGHLYLNGSLKQVRVYGADGKAKYDVDYFHNGENHVFPHIHYFYWNLDKPRKDGVPLDQ